MAAPDVRDSLLVDLDTIEGLKDTLFGEIVPKDAKTSEGGLPASKQCSSG